MYRIRKTFKFEMAHVLSKSYSKECQKCHGHSYKLEIILGTTVINKDGMLIDFKKLKEIVMEHIINKLDHQLVIEEPIGWTGVSGNNLVTKLPWLKDLITVHYNPTAENMVAHFYHQLFPLFRKEIPGLVSLLIRLHETDTGWAEYSGGI